MDNFNKLKSPTQIGLDIAGKMKNKRKMRGLSQEQLSVRSGVSFGSIKRFEYTGEISLISLVKIAFALGAEDDFDDLFSRKEYSSIQEVIYERK